MVVSFAVFHRLPLPAQVRWLTATGRLLAERREAGIRQKLYDVCGFYVETWHWAADGEIGLLLSFNGTAGLDGWLTGLEVE